MQKIVKLRVMVRVVCYFTFYCYDRDVDIAGRRNNRHPLLFDGISLLFFSCHVHMKCEFRNLFF